jgi:hypothetical protein
LARSETQLLHALFLDTLDIARLAPSALDGPARAARQHGVHFGLLERDGAFAADPGRNLAVERVGKRLLHGPDVGQLKARQYGAHAARNVEAHAARRDHAAVVGIEGRNPADRKAVAPVSVGHDVGRGDDARQRRYVCRLVVNLVIHAADEVFIGVDDRRHAHRPARLDAPGHCVDACETCGIHCSRRSLHVHHTAC